MDSKNRERTPFHSSQEGSGSAENKGQDRGQQRAQNTRLDQQKRQDISSQIGSDKNKITDLNDLGKLSGRDDVSGGSGDRMEEQSTGQSTDQ